MSSEDDTFRKLKKATLNDVIHRLSNQTLEEARHGRWIEIVESMGWGHEEYLDKIRSLVSEESWNGVVGD